MKRRNLIIIEHLAYFRVSVLLIFLLSTFYPLPLQIFSEVFLMRIPQAFPPDLSRGRLDPSEPESLSIQKKPGKSWGLMYKIFLSSGIKNLGAIIILP
jgi:hypothetical protein